ncbi:MAG TPA: DUF2157 domain-containing protein [Candidatus Udaeobacter sp.]|nr:DUF2157 domain-containing protein [Candidatus Udaeobacter sp.]
MAGVRNRRAIRWLRSQLPKLVASGVISSENARAIDGYYEHDQPRVNFAFVILAALGSALVAAGIILLIAHNWDDLSRATRTGVAFMPLLIAQALVVFTLMRRNESRPWREATAIFDVAAVATAVSLISQTYQVQGTFADFMRTWLLLSIVIVYLLRTSLGAIAYVIGCALWLFARWSPTENPMLFWFLLMLVIPYVAIRFRSDCESRETTTLVITVALATMFGVGATAEFADASVGAIAYAGLATAIYLCGIKFFPQPAGRLHLVALLGGIAICVATIVLSFESNWHMTYRVASVPRTWAANLAVVVELLFPIAAVCLASFDLLRRRAEFSLSAALFPIVTAIAWAITHLCEFPNERWRSTRCSFAAGTVMNCYALLLGIDILARGIRTNSMARANFGLLLIAALAICRFFDSDLSFVARGVGFIVVGVGFLVANLLLFKRRTAS